MTRKLIVAAYLAAILLACTARTTTKRVIKQAYKSAKTSETLKQPAVYLPTDSLLPTAIHKEIKNRRRKLNQQEIILAIARKFIGTPYVANTLEKNKDEKLVVNLRGMDCTTYLETVLALARCVMLHQYTFQDYLTTLRRLRYRQGRISYINRLHYYQWWLDDNRQMGLVTQIESPNPPFTAVQTIKINYMSQNSQLYTMLKGQPERIRAIRQLENASAGLRERYIPTDELSDTPLLRSTIHNGDIIALVTTKPNLDTTHLGLAVWHADGLHLLNASSLRRNGRQVLEPRETLQAYLHAHPSNPGIRVARLTEPN